MSIPKRSPRSRRTAQIDPNQSRTGISRHIANRELGADEKQQALLASALQGAANAVLFLDLDCFKNVNDALGHAAGDRLLVAVADRLRAAVRKTDTVARMSGDEFTILLPNLDGTGVARALATKLVAAIAQPFALGEQKIETGVSIGIGLYPDDGDNAETLLVRADAAMYRAKTRGRGGFCFVSASKL